MKLLLLAIFSQIFLFASQIIPIHRSWQMVGVSGDLLNLNDFNRSEIKLVWAYNNNTWSVFSSQSDLQEAIGNFNKLSSIPKNSSVWILSDKTGYMKIDANRSNNTHVNLHTGWQMIGNDIGWSSLEDFNRSEVSIVWMYDGMNRKWKAFSPDSQFSTQLTSANIDTLKNIPANKGIWVYANSAFSVDTYKIIEDINSTEDEYVTPTQNAYDYNADGTAFLKIKQEVCNNWENAFSDENFTSADMQTKAKLYKNYVYDALKENKNENQLVYAPRGIAGDFNLTVENDSINLMQYKLPGDLNDDGRVTDDDIELLANILAMKSIVTPPLSYDADNNGVVDHRDLLYVGARLMTQVSTFDIYTTDGRSLNFPSIKWIKKYSLISNPNESSLPSVVRVVARDENGASTSKESKITKDEWYKDIPSPRKVKSRSLENYCPLELSSINSLFPTVASQYLIGYIGSIEVVAGHFVNGVGQIDSDISGCVNAIKNMYLSSHTHKYFIPTDMGYNVEFISKGKGVYIRDGFRFNQNELNNINFINNISKYITTEVYGYNLSIKNSLNHNGEIKNTYAIAHITTILKYSEKKFPMHGEITRNTSDRYQDCGKVKFDRYGPARQKDSESTNLQRVSKSKSKYNFEPKLSMGHYHASIVWPKGGEYLLENDFIIKTDEDEKNFQIPWKPKSVKGHLYDFNNKPLKNKQLILRSTCDPTLKKYYTTKEDGSFEFKHVDIGEYEILVDNKPKATVVQAGNGAQSDIKDKPLWKATLKYSSPFGIGSMTVKKFKLDCENATDYNGSEYFGKLCIEIYDDGTTNIDESSEDKNVSINYSGALHDDTDLSIPLQITTKGILFEAFIPIPDSGADPGVNPGIQFHTTPVQPNNQNSYDSCSGVFPDISQALDDIKNNRKIHFTSTDQGADGSTSTCEFILEPCKNSNCENDLSEWPDDFDEFDDFDSQTQGGVVGPEKGLGD